MKFSRWLNFFRNKRLSLEIFSQKKTLRNGYHTRKTGQSHTAVFLVYLKGELKKSSYLEVF
jgi:hypothetical protein